MFSLQKINLIVIDECHYAAGSHDCNKLMRRFYHPLPTNERPHILGLTASPLVRVKPKHNELEIEQMLDQLETNLNAKVVSIIMQDKDDVTKGKMHAEMTSSAEERDVVYQVYKPKRPLPRIGDLPVHDSRKKESQQLLRLYQDLGPLVLAIYCLTLVRELSRNSFCDETNEEFQLFIEYLKQLAAFGDYLSRNCPLGGRCIIM